MSDDEVFDWGIDAVATNPEGFYVDKIVEVDATTFEEVGKIRASIGRNEDHSAVELSISKMILVKLPDGEVSLKDFLEKTKLTGKSKYAN